MKLSNIIKLLFLASSISSISSHAVDISTESISSSLVAKKTIGPTLFGTINSSREDIEPIVEWEKKQNADQRLEVFGDDFLGDAIDPHTGSLVFSHTDINLAGNSKLQVALTRQRTSGFTYKDGVDAEFGDWTTSVPRITVTSLDGRPWTGQRCTNSSTQILTRYSTRTTSLVARDYSNGVTMEIPGQSSQQLLERNSSAIWPSSAKKVTKENWYFTCISASDGGQGFMGHAPNGDTYRFDKAYVLDAPKMGYIGAQPLERNVYILAATQVKDVNGNYVNYSYDSTNRLRSIIAKDGRNITLNYSGTSKLIYSATAAGKTWRYAYRLNTYRRTEWMPFFPQSLRGYVLSRVTQPDGNYWTMNLDKMSATPAPSGRERCEKWHHSVSITHPYGATGTFVIKDTESRHVYASQIRRYEDCMSGEPGPPGGGYFFSDPVVTAKDNQVTPDAGGIGQTNYYIPLDDDVTTSTMAVTNKTVTGPSMTTATWTYNYENDQRSGTSSSDRTNWTKVTAPDGHHTYYHAWVSEPLAGKLVKKETRRTASGPVLRTEKYTYLAESSVGKSYVLTYPGPGDIETPVHTTKIVTTQSGDTYTSEYGFNTNHNSTSYSYSKPITQSVKSNVSTIARVTSTQFSHNKTKWILSLPVKQIVNLRTTVENVFDGYGRKISEKRNGAAFATYGYHPNGAFAWVRDANLRLTRADSYKRGTPQQVTRANGTKVYQYVDDFGRISSLKDAKGNTTSFSRDTMGRLLVVNPPESWNNTYHSYSFSGNPSHTITLGNARTTITYDAMFRPVLVETRDLLTNTSTFLNYDYDAAGREVFSSFPSTSNSASAGTASEYDGLGRVTSKRETVSPYTTTMMSYHSSHRKTVTDPNNQQTHYYAYGYDGPNGKDIRAIRSPLGKNTDINKNLWGETVYIRQWGNQNNYNVNEYRYYYYDSKRRLCRVREKDVGDTVYQYDNSNWLIAYQKGLSNGTACTAPSGTAKVSLLRDAIGQITKRDFVHSGTPDIDKTFDANGNVLTVNRAGTSWTYAYNTINLPTLERLYVDGRQYQLSYGYNLSGHKSQTVFPTGNTVHYNPDGLGRARRANWNTTYYANNVTYHPSGQIKKFNYGNGHYFTQTLNSRLLPSRLYTYKGSTKALDVSYSYDIRKLVTSISDRAQANNNRYISYDALEQITSSYGPWGAGQFVYDSLGNIRKKNLGSRKVTVNYSNNRVSSSVDTGGIGGNTGTRIFNHDNRGNVKRSGGLNFVYDYADQPTSVTGSVSGQYKYDGNLKRVKSTVGGKTIYNVYDVSGRLVHIDNKTAGKKTDYISIGQMTLARVENNIPTYLHSDNLGSPVAGTNAAGSVLWRERYTPYGITIDNPSENDDQTGFTSHIKDSDTGLVYMQARYYDPVIGRFYSNDPVGVIGHIGRGNPTHGFNRYAYANNSPYKYTDPNGESPLAIFGAVVGAIGGGLSAALNGGDAGEIFSSAVAGGIVGGLAGLTGGTSLLATATTGAVSGASGDFLGQTITNFDGGNIDASSVESAVSTTASAIGDAVSEVNVGEVAVSGVLGGFGGVVDKGAKVLQFSDKASSVITETTNALTSATKDELAQ